MSHAVIRLQNHGCKNHPYFWIVVSSKNKNIKGRIIEHIGYWIPHERRTVHRSIILNKPRILHWLAKGAQPSYKIQQFLSYVDMMPQPLMKHGTATQYERPQKELKKDSMYPLNPYKKFCDKYFLNKIIENEEQNMQLREMYMANEELKTGVKQSKEGLIELEEQWNSLRGELYQLENDTKIQDPLKREELFRKINEIAEKWKKEKQFDDLKKSLGEEINDKNAKRYLIVKQTLYRQMVYASLIEQQNKMQSIVQDLIDYDKPLNESDAFFYLASQSNKQGRSLESQFQTMLYHANKNQQVITKEYIDQFVVKQMPKQEITDRLNSFFQTSYKSYKDENAQLPLSRRPVHPLPDFSQYDPEDYTDILKQKETLIHNKGYQIPNSYMEGDRPGYGFEDQSVQLTIRKRYKRGRSAKYKHRYLFCSMKQIEKAVNML